MNQMSLSAQTTGKTACLTDAFGRAITYLRLSVTDRCNLRCQYCMGKNVTFLPKADVLTLEEMEQLCAAFIRLGVRKIRLTGGEPLLRHGVMGLIQRLGARLAPGEFDELTLTTNGTRLAAQADELAAAGVRRVNVSLDTLDAAVFREITQHDGLTDVLEGIRAARQAQLGVRVNVVALAGTSDADYDRMIRWCGAQGCDMALIELMPFGSGESGLYQPLDPVRDRLAERWTLTPTESNSGGPCRYWNVAETGCRVGFITPLSHGFCSACNRVRVTCTGQLVPCMAQQGSVDLRPALRGPNSDEALDAAIIAAIRAKPDAHQFHAISPAPAAQRMWQMGG